jgi:hypothetical protein
MSRTRILVALLASIATALAVTVPAFGETTHTYAVTLTIGVDRSADRIEGTIGSDAPSEFCDSSTVRLMRATSGKDKVVARIDPVYGEWRIKSFPAIRGKRVYAEVLSYHLPERPVVCLGARSRAVTAP